MQKVTEKQSDISPIKEEVLDKSTQSQGTLKYMFEDQDFFPNNIIKMGTKNDIKNRKNV